MDYTENNPGNEVSKAETANKLLGEHFKMSPQADGYWQGCTGLVRQHENPFGKLGPSPFRLFSQESNTQFPFLRDEETQSREKDSESNRDPIKIQLNQCFSLVLKWSSRKNSQKLFFPRKNKEQGINSVNLLSSNTTHSLSRVPGKKINSNCFSSFTSWISKHVKTASPRKRIDPWQDLTLLEETDSNQAEWNVNTRFGNGQSEAIAHHRALLNKSSSSNAPHEKGREASVDYFKSSDKSLPVYRLFPIIRPIQQLNQEQEPSYQETDWNSDIRSRYRDKHTENKSFRLNELQSARKSLPGNIKEKIRDFARITPVISDPESIPGQKARAGQSTRWSPQKNNLETIKLPDISFGSEGPISSRFALKGLVNPFSNGLVDNPWFSQYRLSNLETEVLKKEQLPESSGETKTGIPGRPSHERSSHLGPSQILGSDQKRKRIRLSIPDNPILSGWKNPKATNKTEVSVTSDFSHPKSGKTHRSSFNFNDQRSMELKDVIGFELPGSAQTKAKNRFPNTKKSSQSSMFSSQSFVGLRSNSPSTRGWFSLTGRNNPLNENGLKTESQGNHFLAPVFTLSTPVYSLETLFKSSGKPVSIQSGVSNWSGKAGNAVKEQIYNLANDSSRINSHATEEKKEVGILSRLKSQDQEIRIRKTLMEPARVAKDISQTARNAITALVESQERAISDMEMSSKESNLLIRKLVEQLTSSQQNSRSDAKALLQAVQTLSHHLKKVETEGLAQQGSRMRPLHFLGPL